MFFFLVFSSLALGQSQTDCDIALNAFKSMGGQTSFKDGCKLPGVTSSNKTITEMYSLIF